MKRTLTTALIATVVAGVAPLSAQDSLAVQDSLPPKDSVAARESQPAGWQVKRASQTDLWFHALAVIQADQPGPLGLYSADYARRIREIKQERGVFPTMLDSLATELRKAFDEDPDLATLHFAPLYFPRAEPGRMLRALRAVAKRRTNDTALTGRDVRLGAFQFSRAFQKGKTRRVLESLVNAVEEEWKVFYEEYWHQRATEVEPLYDGIQALWDSALWPYLKPFLDRRRLSGGIVMPSPALGPEGRIVEIDQFDPDDQVVAVQLPLMTQRPEAATFAFLKELCFLLIDARFRASLSEDPAEREDLERTLAVRCGSLILDFYAPTQTARYRRVFLDAVGAEESATVGAFERVYALEPSLYDRLREQIRRR